MEIWCPLVIALGRKWVDMNELGSNGRYRSTGASIDVCIMLSILLSPNPDFWGRKLGMENNGIPATIGRLWQPRAVELPIGQ